MSFRVRLTQVVSSAQLHEVMRELQARGSPDWTLDAVRRLVPRPLWPELDPYFDADGRILRWDAVDQVADNDGVSDGMNGQEVEVGNSKADDYYVDHEPPLDADPAPVHASREATTSPFATDSVRHEWGDSLSAIIDTFHERLRQRRSAAHEEELADAGVSDVLEYGPTDEDNDEAESSEEMPTGVGFICPICKTYDRHGLMVWGGPPTCKVCRSPMRRV